MLPVILHISNDFPDPLAPDKTKAVQHLIDGTPQYRHIVYSLNRVNGWSGLESLSFAPDRTAVAYKALPKGLFWKRRLQDVAEWISQDLNKKGIVPHLVQGHKFTVEGIIALRLAEKHGIPLVCNIQGDTDTRILQTKVNYREEYQAIADKAAVIFPFAYWPIPQFRQYLTIPVSKFCVLPVIPALDVPSPASIAPQPRFISVFHLDSYQRKNIGGMLEALTIVHKSFPQATLDVYGRGQPESLMQICKLIRQYDLNNAVTLKGPTANNQLPQLLKNYTGFILPSKRESYGLVYAESLLSGVPILFGKDRGIDGFFKTEDIGTSCDPFSASSIADGMISLIRNEETLKQSIQKLQLAGAMDIIRREHILAFYHHALDKILTS